jgi:hypothetical protein
MAANVTVNTTGFRSLGAALRSRSATLQGVAAGIVVLNHAVRAAAPRSSGALAAAQDYLAVRGSRGQTVSYAVQGVRTAFVRTVRRPRQPHTQANPALYDLFVRLGTRPHGGHPGTRPNDYRRQAMLTAGMLARNVALAVMGAAVQKEIAAHAKI